MPTAVPVQQHLRRRHTVSPFNYETMATVVPATPSASGIPKPMVKAQTTTPEPTILLTLPLRCMLNGQWTLIRWDSTVTAAPAVRWVTRTLPMVQRRTWLQTLSARQDTPSQVGQRPPMALKHITISRVWTISPPPTAEYSISTQSGQLTNTPSSLITMTARSCRVRRWITVLHRLTRVRPRLNLPQRHIRTRSMVGVLR